MTVLTKNNFENLKFFEDLSSKVSYPKSLVQTFLNSFYQMIVIRNIYGTCIQTMRN